MKTLVIMMMAFSTLAQGETEVIEVKEQRLNPSDSSYIEVIEAKEIWEQSLSFWIHRNPSLRLIQGALPSATGFGIPSARGRSAKYTEIFLSHWLLQDPLTGFSLADEIDLRFFGKLSLQLGQGAIDNSSLSPIATLVYQMKDVGISQRQWGYESGDVYGNSLWLLWDYGNDQFASRSYARSHQGSGSYKIFNNNATPLLSSDDRLLQQTNNDQRSMQAMNFSSWSTGSHQTTVLSRYYKKNYGIAPANSYFPGAVRAESIAQLVLADYSYFGSPYLNFTLTAGWRQDQQQTQDPKREVLGTYTSFSRLNTAEEVGFQIQPKFSIPYELLWRAKRSHLVVDSFGDDSYTLKSSRTIDRLYLGEVYKFANWLHLQTKHEWQKVSSTHMAPETREDSFASHSLTLFGSLLRGNRLNYNLQLSRNQSPPYLLAEFGDGAGTVANQNINPESILHREISFISLTSLWRARLGYFNDQIDHKIVFIPISLGQEKAINLSEAAMQGWEASVEWNFDYLSFLLAGTRMQAYHRNSFGKYVLPRLPLKSFVTQLGFSQESVSAYLSSRLEGVTYRDDINRQKLPEHWITDLGASYRLNRGGWHLELSFGVFNVFDYNRMTYTTGFGSGAIPYSKVDGTALPGRHFKFALQSRH